MGVLDDFNEPGGDLRRFVMKTVAKLDDVDLDLWHFSKGVMTGVVSHVEPFTILVAVAAAGMVEGQLVNVDGVLFELRKFHAMLLTEPNIREYEASIFVEEDLRERARALAIAERRGLL